MQTTMCRLIVVILAGMANRGFGETGIADSDRAKFQGRWEVTATERAGVKQEGCSGLQYEFSGDELIITAGAKSHGSTTYRLDETARPKQIDWLIRDVVDAKHIKTEVVKGIYAIEGDRLTICIPMYSPRTPRPIMFKTENTDDEEKKTIILETLRRIPLADPDEERKRNEAAVARIQEEAFFRLQPMVSRRNQGKFDVDFHQHSTTRTVFPTNWQHLVDLREIRSLVFRACAGVGNDEMCFVAKLIALESLDLHSTDVGDAGIAQLSGLNNLEYLDLSFTAVSDAGLAGIANMGNLRKLILKGTSVTDKAIESLLASRKDLVIERPRPYAESQQRAAAELSRLGMPIDDSLDQYVRPAILTCQVVISPTQVVDSTIARKEDERGNSKLYGKRAEASVVASLLSRLPAPISVTMAGKTTDDSVLKCIHDVQGVVRLSLQMSHISDAGLAELERHKELKVLDLSYCKRITERGVAGLASLTNLESLDLSGIDLTSAGLSPLLKLDHLKAITIDPKATRSDLIGKFRQKGVELRVQ